MKSNQIRIILSLIFVIIVGCDDPQENIEPKNDQEELVEKLPVQLQVIGSLEGIIVCDSNSSCKETDSNGVVSFDTFGHYSFKINDINISTFEIDSNITVVSPYKLFEDNETLAKNFLLLLHAFDKGSDIADEEVSLSFSSYIPTATTIKNFINLNLQDNNLSYSVNDHNITIDTVEHLIDRDGINFDIDIPTKESYTKLKNISDFIGMAKDKNVTLGNISTKYILNEETPTSFTLGERYRFRAYIKEEDVLIDIYDNSSRTTDNAKLIIDDDNSTLVTNLISIIVMEE